MDKNYKYIGVREIKIVASGTEVIAALMEAHHLAFTQNQVVVLEFDEYRYTIDPIQCIEDCEEGKERIN